MASPDRWKDPQVRGGWRCSLCSITYPNDRDRFMLCPACGEACSYFSNVEVDEDWVERAADLVSRWEGGAHNTFPRDWLIPETEEEA